MSRAVITLNSNELREQATYWVSQAPPGTRVEFRAPQRTLPQNDLMWSRLTDVARQTDWHGQKLTPTDWKDMFTAGLRRARIVPNIDGDGFVQLGLHTSEMSKEEMGNLLDLIDAFGAERGVTFQDLVSNSSEQPVSPVGAQADAPEAQSAPASASGQQSEPSTVPSGPDVDERDEDGGGDETPSSSLPDGTLILYAAALRRAQKKESLSKYAKVFWETHGGWEKWQHTTDGATAAAIFNIFRDHFGNKEQIELQLRELI